MKISQVGGASRVAPRFLVRLAIPVALAVGLPTAVSAEPAVPGQSVAELQQRAAEIAAELSRLDLATNQLDEEYNSVALELTVLREQRAENQNAVDAAQTALLGHRDAARTAAIQAFVGENPVDVFDVRAFDDIATDSRRRTYLTSVFGNRGQAIDDLGAAQQDLADREKQLQQAAGKVDQHVSALDRSRVELERTIAARRELQGSVDGALQVAVEAERERRAAQAEARAAAEARTAAARQRESERMRAMAVGRSVDPVRAAQSPIAQPTGGPVAAAPVVQTGGTPGGDIAVRAALEQLGDPYRWGSTGPDSFDCSGLVTYAYRQANVSLPRSSRAMRAATRRISEDQLVPGDLVFGGSPVHHVGIYIGNGQMVHSPQSGDVVKVSGIYRSSGPVSFGRI